MTKRLSVTPAPGPLEKYAQNFDGFFNARVQREGFRRYLEGLLLSAERNKALTALANAEPLVEELSTPGRRDWNYPEVTENFCLRYRNLLHSSLFVV